MTLQGKRSIAFGLGLALIVGAAIAQNAVGNLFVGPLFFTGPVDINGSLTVHGPTDLYTAADGGGSDTNDCSQAHPCATVEAARAKAPNDLDRQYTLHVGGGTYSAGAHMVGLRQVLGPDGGAGSLIVDCDMNPYSPGDGGSAFGTLGAVATGSGATRDVWTIDGGTFNNDELKGYQIEVVSGTGTAPERWVVTTNTANALTIGGVSGAIGPTTAPAVGSVVKLWTRAVTFSGAGLSDTMTPVGFPPQTAVASHFIVDAVKGINSDSIVPVVKIRGCKFAGTTRGVAFTGPVALEENECASTTSTCFRAMDGIVVPVVRRNIATAGASSFVVQGNTANGSFAPSVQLYNNFSTGTVVSLFAGGQVGLLLTGMNEFTTSSESIRVNSVLDGQSRYDKLTSGSACVRSPLTIDATDVGSGIKMNFTGLSCTSTGVYSIMLAGRSNRVNLDSASTVTSTNHHAALADGAQLFWASGAAWGGAGADDFTITDTGGTLTEAGVTSGATEKLQWFGKGGAVGIPTHAGGIYSPVVAPIGSNSGADGQLQLCAGSCTATNGACAAITFANVARCAAFSATPSCWCAVPGDAGTAVGCGFTAISSTGVTFVGDTNLTGSSTIRWGCAGAK